MLALFSDRVLPIAMLVAGFIVTALWIGLIGYGLSKLFL